MTYTPIISGSGLVGWQMLQRTISTQKTAFDNSSEVARESKYFRENIGSVATAENLVEDRRLLNVTLSAFGLQDQIESKFLIQRILEEDPDAEGSLVSRLGNSAYTALANIFDFSETAFYKTQEEGFGVSIFERYEASMLSDLKETLKESQYMNDPIYAASFEQKIIDTIKKNKKYFFEVIGQVRAAEDILNDYDLKEIVIKAFDIEDRKNSLTLLKRVLEEGSSDSEALANVLADRKLKSLAQAFEFDKAIPTTALQSASFVGKIENQYRWQLFEDAVGGVDSAIGIALTFQRSIPDLSSSDISENAKWYSVLGSQSMRTVFEKALNLPNGFSQIDIDKQIVVLKEKSDRKFGITSFDDLGEVESIQKIVGAYLLQDLVSRNDGAGEGSIALKLLRS